MTETISALVAVGALAFAVATYLAYRRQNRIDQADQLLFQINALVLEHPDIVPAPEGQQTERQAAYATIVWNFLECIYLRKLRNERYLQPAMKQLVGMYREWFEENENLYDPDFVDFVNKRFAKA